MEIEAKVGIKCCRFYRDLYCTQLSCTVKTNVKRTTETVELPISYVAKTTHLQVPACLQIKSTRNG